MVALTFMRKADIVNHFPHPAANALRHLRLEGEASANLWLPVSSVAEGGK